MEQQERAMKLIQAQNMTQAEFKSFIQKYRNNIDPEDLILPPAESVIYEKHYAFLKGPLI